MLPSGKALSLWQGKDGGEIQIRQRRFAQILSSHGTERHWEFMVDVAAKECRCLARILGETDRCHIKAPLFLFPLGSSVPTPEFSGGERGPSQTSQGSSVPAPRAQTGLEHYDLQSFCFVYWQ